MVVFNKSNFYGTTKMLIFLIVLTVLVLAVFYWYFATNNNLVRLQEEYKNAFAQIDVQLKRRYDLIPNLVNTVKAYLKHESETLIKVAAARSGALAALQAFKENIGDEQSAIKMQQANADLNSALKSLSIQIESYPELKANENIARMQEELTSTENKIGFARQAYNDSVTEFNIYRKQFPNSIVANSRGFTKDATLLQFEDKAEISKAPKVEF